MNYFILLNLFGSTAAELARTLKVSSAAVAQWRRAGKVPPLQVYRLHQLTNGRIPIHDDFFDEAFDDEARKEH